MTAVPRSDLTQSDDRVMSSNRLEFAMIIAGILFMLAAMFTAAVLL